MLRFTFLVSRFRSATLATTTINSRVRQTAQQAARPNKVNARRVIWVLVFFMAFALYDTYTVFNVQVVQHSTLSNMAENTITWKDTLVPQRGVIYDTHGQLLAGNITAHDVNVDITNHRNDTDELKIASLLGPVLGQNAQDLYNKLKGVPTTIRSTKVAGQVDDATVARIEQLITDNSTLLSYTISMDAVPLRQYPNNALAASVLGFVSADDKGHYVGRYGVEEYYNSTLAGQEGWIIAEHDSMGRPLVLAQPETQPAVDGSDVTLTIDSAVQYLVEQGLQDAIKKYGASSGYAVVQDPNTGAILAMANYPTFDPNQFGKVNDYSLFLNPAVNDVREPGSTMKILTYSSSIDAGAIISTTTFNDPGYVTKYGFTIHNATAKDWGTESMQQGLARSNNVAAIFAAEQLGQDKYFNYLKQFGMGKLTGIDLPGEAAGLMSWPDSDGYSPLDFYETAFGQTAALTPVQLVTGVSAVANGGTLLKPFVMKQVTQDGKVIESNSKQVVRQVIKPSAAGEVAQMMAWGVENKGVARLAAVPGYHVSVKTGTADISAGTSGYTGDTLASAMGFAPTVNPKFTLYVALMHPTVSPWGENTASPAWGLLAQQLLLYMKVQPTSPLPTATPGG